MYTTKTDKKRYIAHVDMDAFFAAVEQRDNPSYKRKPVVIGANPKHGNGRGVVFTCSYEARKFGIHSAMPISTAYNRCSNAVFIPPDMKKYSEVSRQIFGILERFTPDIEPVGIDEAFLDITGSYRIFSKTPEALCKKLKNAVKNETGLTISVGLAPSKMAAKIASDLKKPDGLVVVKDEHILDFLHPLAIEKLWGIGAKTSKMLNSMGVHTIGDLASQDITKLESVFGKHGRHAWKLANGIDPRIVEPVGSIRSVSNEHTFEKDTDNINEIKDILMFLSEKVSRHLRKLHFKSRTITLKIRFSDFKTYTRSITLGSPTHFTDIIYKNSLKKLETFDISSTNIRLLGVCASNLVDPAWPTDLYDGPLDQTSKKQRLHNALDRVLDKFGEGALGHRNV